MNNFKRISLYDLVVEKLPADYPVIALLLTNGKKESVKDESN